MSSLAVHIDDALSCRGEIGSRDRLGMPTPVCCLLALGETEEQSAEGWRDTVQSETLEEERNDVQYHDGS